jgi:hypothetical protein
MEIYKINKMEDQELIKNLKALSNIRTDNVWKEANRNVLSAQINYGISGEEKNESAVMSLRDYFSVFSDFIYNGFVRQAFQPAVASAFALILVFVGGIFSFSAARDTTPGDSLYPAKLFREKTQYSLTFDDKEKTKLNIEFAQNRVEELAKVLSEGENDANKKDQVAQLASNFKKEIENAKQGIEKINTLAVNNDVAKNNQAVKTDQVADDISKDKAEDEMMFSANLEKDKAGLNLSESGDTAPEPVVLKATTTELAESAVKETEYMDDVATTSDKETVDSPVMTNTQTIFQEAKDLFEKDDYQAAVEKLDQVVTHVDKEVADDATKDNAEQAVATSTSEEAN